MVVLCYDKKAKESSLYRKTLDDLPADSFGDFKVTGPKGIEAFVLQYSATGVNKLYEEISNSKWPTSEMEMREMQR